MVLVGIIAGTYHTSGKAVDTRDMRLNLASGKVFQVASRLGKVEGDTKNIFVLRGDDGEVVLIKSGADFPGRFILTTGGIVIPLPFSIPVPLPLPAGKG